MNRIMLDLETYGRVAGCPVLSIGAVYFSSTDFSWEGPNFYSEISLADSERCGLRADQDTIDWWAKQTPEARRVIEAATAPDAPAVMTVLAKFTKFIDDYSAGRDAVQIWGNGSDFDNTILAALYDAVELATPWRFFNNRCYRTLKGLQGHGEKLARFGTYHNALDDARSQAEHAVRILRKMRFGDGTQAA